MSPRGPNEKIIAMAVVNGGDTSGSNTAASSAASNTRGSRQRAAVNANRKPSIVPPSPTRTANKRLFQNARIWCLSVSTARRPAVVNVPWSVSTRPSSITIG